MSKDPRRDSGPLFEAAMARKTDPDTSREAAAIVRKALTALQVRVLEAVRTHGPISARQAERLPEFDSCSPSTVRKRVSELHRGGFLTEDGRETESGRAPATVYRVAP